MQGTQILVGDALPGVQGFIMCSSSQSKVRWSSRYCDRTEPGVGGSGVADNTAISPSCVRAPSRQGQQLLRWGCGSGRCYFAPLDTLWVVILRIFEVSFKLSPRRESCITLVTLVALVTLAPVYHNLFSINNYPIRICSPHPPLYRPPAVWCIPDICYGSHGYTRVNFFWPV